MLSDDDCDDGLPEVTFNDVPRRASGKRFRRRYNPNEWGSSILTNRHNVLCLGMSYPCVESVINNYNLRNSNGTLRKQKLNQTIFNSAPSVERSVELVRRNLLNEIDGRDLARVAALEANNDILAYTVSIEQGSYYDQRHLDANFNRNTLVSQMNKRWGDTVRFRQVILDYFWSPSGSWAMKHWQRSFFHDNIPRMVTDNLLNYGDLKDDITFVSALEEGNVEDNYISSTAAVVYLPFGSHCLSQVVACYDKLSQFYTIGFLRKDQLDEHTLWKATNTICAESMRGWLSKNINQEEQYCKLDAREIKCGTGDSSVTTEEILNVFNRIDRADEVRMIKLTALRKFHPNFKSHMLRSKPSLGMNKGGYIGLKKEQSSKEKNEKKRKVSPDSNNMQHGRQKRKLKQIARFDRQEEAGDSHDKKKKSAVTAKKAAQPEPLKIQEGYADLSSSTHNKEKKKQSSTSSSSNSKATSRSSRINIEIPHQKLTKSIRNNIPSQIDTHGFVELSNILPSQLLTNIKQHAISKLNNDTNDIEIISNALQIDLSKELFNEMKVSLGKNEIVEETMKFVYGQPPPPTASSAEGVGDNMEDTPQEQPKKSSSNYNGYIVETPKILVALPGSAPQLPHADDHCSSCIICLLHLGNGQEPTRVAVYDKEKDYPTGITVTCDKCNREEMLPDHDYRRGVHLTDESWYCNCKEPWQQYDFEGKLVSAFSELLERGAPDLCDSYCGKEDIKMGDGYLALPTLIHRGPGNASSSAEPRYMLFFTLRPQYANATSSAAHYHKYNPDLQIHAATVLFNQFNMAKNVYAGSGCDVAGRFGTIVSRDCSKILGENEVLREENASMRAILEDMNVAVPKEKKKKKKRKMPPDIDVPQQKSSTGRPKRNLKQIARFDRQEEAGDSHDKKKKKSAVTAKKAAQPEPLKCSLREGTNVHDLERSPESRARESMATVATASSSPIVLHDGKTVKKAAKPPQQNLSLPESEDKDPTPRRSGNINSLPAIGVAVQQAEEEKEEDDVDFSNNADGGEDRGDDMPPPRLAAPEAAVFDRQEEAGDSHDKKKKSEHKDKKSSLSEDNTSAEENNASTASDSENCSVSSLDFMAEGGGNTDGEESVAVVAINHAASKGEGVKMVEDQRITIDFEAVASAVKAASAATSDNEPPAQREGHTCSGCNKYFKRADYSGNQWDRNRSTPAGPKCDKCKHKRIPKVVIARPFKKEHYRLMTAQRKETLKVKAQREEIVEAHKEEKKNEKKKGINTELEQTLGVVS